MYLLVFCRIHSTGTLLWNRSYIGGSESHRGPLGYLSLIETIPYESSVTDVFSFMKSQAWQLCIELNFQVKICWSVIAVSLLYRELSTFLCNLQCVHHATLVEPYWVQWCSSLQRLNIATTSVLVLAVATIPAFRCVSIVD